MLFKRELHDGLVSGAVTLSFRLWSRPQVRAGGRYRVPPSGVIEVDSIERVRLDAVSDAEAIKAGHAGRAELRAYLARTARRRVRADTPVFRVAFHYAGRERRARPELRASISRADAQDIEARLARMDRASSHGPWTGRTLELIAASPRVRAAELAARVKRETRPFKVDVRKLKRLGLTLSLDVGYELSPRGRAFLAARRS